MQRDHELLKMANAPKWTSIDPLHRHWKKNSLAHYEQQSQSKWLGHFGVSLSPQCWCIRFGDRTAINNFEREEGSTKRKTTAFG